MKSLMIQFLCILHLKLKREAKEHFSIDQDFSLGMNSVDSYFDKDFTLRKPQNLLTLFGKIRE